MEKHCVIHRQIPVFLFIQFQFTDLFEYNGLVYIVLLKCFEANEIF